MNDSPPFIKKLLSSTAKDVAEFVVNMVMLAICGVTHLIGYVACITIQAGIILLILSVMAALLSTQTQYVSDLFSAHILITSQCILMALVFLQDILKHAKTKLYASWLLHINNSKG